MQGLFKPGNFIANSPVQRSRYESRQRRSFLIGALRTRSLFSREELARIISPLTLDELLLRLDPDQIDGTFVPGEHRLRLDLMGRSRTLRRLYLPVRRSSRSLFRASRRVFRFVLRRLWRFSRRAFRFVLRAIRFVLRRTDRLVRLPLRLAITYVGLLEGSIDIESTTSPIWRRVVALKKYRLAWLGKPAIWLLRPLSRGIQSLVVFLTPHDSREGIPELGNSLSELASDIQAIAESEASPDDLPVENPSLVLKPEKFGKLKRFWFRNRIKAHYKSSAIAVLDLAWLHSNQGIYDSDVATAWRIYKWFEARYGLAAMPHMHVVDYALLASRVGRREEAVALAGRAKSSADAFHLYSPRHLATTAALAIQHSLDRSYANNLELSVQPKFLRVDASNPLRGAEDPLSYISAHRAEVTAWLDQLSSAIIPGDVARLGILNEPKMSLLDSLSAPFELPKIHDGPKVTVVMSAFQPDQSILSAARSVLESTYQNLELLVIDDCSGPDYADILAQVGGLDARVKVLHQKENGGTYRIRNRAMDEGTGELMTFHDSDDWIHPQRLEKQVRRLTSTKKIGNISMSTRLTHNLEAAESIRRLRIGLCEPSLLFWRERARDVVGYFDTVRKGGDSEYRRRLERAFGQDLEVVDPFRCLTIQRADNGGLTQGDLGFRWIVDFRLTYRDSFNHFQKSAEPLFIPRSEQRSFYAPRPMRIPRSMDTETRKLDLVIAANAHDPANAKELVEQVEQAVQSGLKVGYWQLNSLYPYSNPKTIRTALLDLMNAGQLESVYPSDLLEIAELRIIAPSSLLASYRPMNFRWTVKKRVRTKAADAAETWRAEGAGIEDRIRVLAGKVGKLTRSTKG